MVNSSVHTKRTLPFNCSNTVDTRRRFNVYKKSYRRLIDVETTSCAYWEYNTRNLTDSMKPIAIAKRNLFFHYRDAKEILFYYFRDTKLCAKHEKTQVNSIFIVGIMFVR